MEAIGKLLPCFRGQLSAETIRALEMVCQVRSYPGGERLFEEGGESCGLFVLLCGSARLIIGSKTGKIYVLRTVKPGEIMGAAGLIAGYPHFCAAEIMAPSSAARLDPPAPNRQAPRFGFDLTRQNSGFARRPSGDKSPHSQISG